MIQFETTEDASKKAGKSPKILPANIKVLGVGGAGCNIVSRICSEKWSHINFATCDSSARALSRCGNIEKILLGESLTRGWGTGGDKEIAGRVAQEGEDKIRSVVSGVDLLFVVCGLGKGLGTGASPLVLKVAREKGTLSIGFFVLPFSFEGRERMMNSQQALSSLWQLVDGAVVVSNDILLRMERANSGESSLSLKEVFAKIDGVFGYLLRSVHDILYYPGIIGLDFADIKSFLAKGKKVIISAGEGNGEGCVRDAVEKALYSSVWGRISFEKANSILLIIRAGQRFKLEHLEKIILSLRQRAGSSIPITFGVYTEKDISDELILTVMTSNTEALEQEFEKSGESYQQELELGVYDQKDLDVPTFLRKQHN